MCYIHLIVFRYQHHCVSYDDIFLKDIDKNQHLGTSVGVRWMFYKHLITKVQTLISWMCSHLTYLLWVIFGVLSKTDWHSWPIKIHWWCWNCCFFCHAYCNNSYFYRISLWQTTMTKFGGQLHYLSLRLLLDFTQLQYDRCHRWSRLCLPLRCIWCHLWFVGVCIASTLVFCIGSFCPYLQFFLCEIDFICLCFIVYIDHLFSHLGHLLYLDDYGFCVLSYFWHFCIFLLTPDAHNPRTLHLVLVNTGSLNNKWKSNKKKALCRKKKQTSLPPKTICCNESVALVEWEFWLFFLLKLLIWWHLFAPMSWNPVDKINLK